ncbi:MAG: cyclic lactone autoinducer peptide [Clostridia bacterium]|nr:cyclic lactone autoinducer peptide [Clostridia bacterium]
MRKIFVSLLASILTVLAFANIAAASGNCGYQPEIPSRFKS